jgi:hypothetical protein
MGPPKGYSLVYGCVHWDLVPVNSFQQRPAAFLLRTSLRRLGLLPEEQKMTNPRKSPTSPRLRPQSKSSSGSNPSENVTQCLKHKCANRAELMSSALDASKNTNGRKPCWTPSIFHFNACKGFGVTDTSSTSLEVQLELGFDKGVLCHCFLLFQD